MNCWIQIFTLACAAAAWGYQPPVFPYAPAAGLPGSTAVARDDPRIAGWAVAVHAVQYGLEVADDWKRPDKALGPAGGNTEDVLVLGRGGSVVLEFDPAIADGDGDDFAVFENAIHDTFLELAHVEVSSDGERFVRFPGYSQTAAPVPAFGDVQPAYVHGLAGKYRIGFGTPFDLKVLADAHAAALRGEGGFSDEFRRQLLDNYPFLDPAAVRYVRIVDIVGDGSDFDCEGYAIYDPYPTVITAGFDLDGVGVINQAPARTGFAGWSAARGLAPLPGADGDGDGWPQYLEYLLGSDPLDPHSAPSVSLALDARNGENLLEFTVDPAAIGEPIVQYSRCGGEWREAVTEVVAVDSGGDASGLERRRARIPAADGGAMLLWRLVSDTGAVEAAQGACK
jgi:hypothetical protein